MCASSGSGELAPSPALLRPSVSTCLPALSGPVRSPCPLLSPGGRPELGEAWLKSSFQPCCTETCPGGPASCLPTPALSPTSAVCWRPLVTWLCLLVPAPSCRSAPGTEASQVHRAPCADAGRSVSEHWANVDAQQRSARLAARRGRGEVAGVLRRREQAQDTQHQRREGRGGDMLVGAQACPEGAGKAGRAPDGPQSSVRLCPGGHGCSEGEAELVGAWE